MALVNIASKFEARYYELLNEIKGSIAESIKVFADSVRKHRLDESRPLLKGDPEELQDTLRAIQESYQRDPKKMEEYWAKLPSNLFDDYYEITKRRLDIVTTMVLIDTVQKKWSELFSLSGMPSNQLLELSIAEDCLSRFEGASQRAGRLLEWLVNQAPSEQADQYLSEASTCFIYGLYASGAVMCRSLLEEVIERKLPRKYLDEGLLKDLNNRTLGNCLDVMNNNVQDLKLHFHEDVPEYSRRVNEIGSRAAHERSLEETEALKCLQDTREAIRLLLG